MVFCATILEEISPKHSSAFSAGAMAQLKTSGAAERKRKSLSDANSLVGKDSGSGGTSEYLESLQGLKRVLS